MMNNNIILIGAGIIITLFLLYLILTKLIKSEETVEETYLNELDHDIEHAEKYLESLKKQIATTELVKETNLTTLENAVVDMYEQSNIKLPLEIIEDTHHMKLTSKDDIISYIETQRDLWKKENSKKLFIRKDN